MKLIILLSSVLCFLSGFAVADQTAPAVDCETPRTNDETIQCAIQEWQSADAELNRAYRQTIEILQQRPQGPSAGAADDGDPVERLRTAQRRWLAYRDATCAAQRALAEGGSLRHVYYYTCLTEVTNARIEELKRLRDL